MSLNRPKDRRLLIYSSTVKIMVCSLDDVEGAKILVVDDTPYNVRLLSRVLFDHGYRVIYAVNGEEAVAKAESEHPDLVLLDITLPDIDGYEVCQRLKHSKQTQDIPVVVISVLDAVGDKVKAFEMGATDYITKPFHVDEVRARVKNQLMIRSLQRQLQQRNDRLRREITEKERALKELEIALLELRQAELSLQVANQDLLRLATIDDLTQLVNRRQFYNYLRQEWRRLSREGLPLALILCDVDYFKLYNDTYGHQAGDSCLQQIAQAIAQAVHRPADMVARYGGEEFAVILSNTDAMGAMHIGKLIQEEVDRLRIDHSQSPLLPYITISLGIATMMPQVETPPDMLVQLADQALYDSKRQGRNRITLRDYANPNV